MSIKTDNIKRMELLEAALLEYVELYGLSETARAAFTQQDGEQAHSLNVLELSHSEQLPVTPRKLAIPPDSSKGCPETGSEDGVGAQFAFRNDFLF